MTLDNQTLYNKIRHFVEVWLGHTWEEKVGIVTVTTPNGEIWDFTIPTKKEKT